jgi:hypothetical protein
MGWAEDITEGLEDVRDPSIGLEMDIRPVEADMEVEVEPLGRPENVRNIPDVRKRDRLEVEFARERGGVNLRVCEGDGKAVAPGCALAWCCIDAVGEDVPSNFASSSPSEWRHSPS